MEASNFNTGILKTLRKEAGLYQKDLAQQLGVSRETVLHIEKGKPASVRSLELSLLQRWFHICSEKASPLTKKHFALEVCAYFSIGSELEVEL